MSADPPQEGRRRNAFGGRGLRQGNPYHDLVGTVRRSPDGTWLAILLPSPPSEFTWHVQAEQGSGGYERPERIWHWPIVGAVPWSPAAGVPLDGSVLTPNTMTATTDYVMAPARVAMAAHEAERAVARAERASRPAPTVRPAETRNDVQVTGDRL